MMKPYKFLYLVVLIILSNTLVSCNSSKIDSKEVKQLIDSISSSNRQGDFVKSYRLLSVMDSLYPLDTKIRERVVLLYHHTQKVEAQVMISRLQDSLSQKEMAIPAIIAQNDIVKVADKEDGTFIFIPEPMKRDEYNKVSAVRLEVDNNAVVSLISVYISTQNTPYQSLVLRDAKGEKLWQSKVVPADQGLNYNYHQFGKWVHTVRFGVDSIPAFSAMINNFVTQNKNHTMKAYLMDKTKVKAIIPIPYKRVVLMQKLLQVRKYYAGYLIDRITLLNYKKRWARLNIEKQQQ